MIHGTEAMAGAEAGRAIRTRVDGQQPSGPDSGNRPDFSLPRRGWYNSTILGIFLRKPRDRIPCPAEVQTFPWNVSRLMLHPGCPMNKA